MYRDRTVAPKQHYLSLSVCTITVRQTVSVGHSDVAECPCIQRPLCWSPRRYSHPLSHFFCEYHQTEKNDLSHHIISIPGYLHFRPLCHLLGIITGQSASPRDSRTRYNNPGKCPHRRMNSTYMCVYLVRVDRRDHTHLISALHEMHYVVTYSTAPHRHRISTSHIMQITACCQGSFAVQID